MLGCNTGVVGTGRYEPVVAGPLAHCCRGDGGPAERPRGLRRHPGGAEKRPSGARAEIFQLDSEGAIAPIIDSLPAAGVNSILLNEPAAGIDMVDLRDRYGTRLKFVGGIDKFAPRTSREAVDRELA